jgi:UDP-galactopyranose mutase
MEDLIKNYDVVVVGAGLSGCVLAERLASCLNFKVLILEKRNHIGGNCYDYVDENGIRINKYGAHLFHTNDRRVWDYINFFDKWIRWEHTVVGFIDGQFVPIPVNITTVNKLCETTIQTEEEMKQWLSQHQPKISSIQNGEDMARSRVGDELYKKIFREYTFKQWGKYPEELKPEVLARIPVRANFDTRYFSDKYQALPQKGYTHFFERLLDNPLIQVRLGVDFFSIDPSSLKEKIVIYTGPIDLYFANQGYPKLEYRSLRFEIESFKNMNFYQPNSVVNYPQSDTEFTRIVEYKHFLNQSSPHTTIVKEYSMAEGEPYYPVLTEKNLELFQQYKELAEKESDVHFIGRLANYKYFNMDEAIANALDYFENIFLKKKLEK